MKSDANYVGSKAGDYFKRTCKVERFGVQSHDLHFNTRAYYKRDFSISTKTIFLEHRRLTYSAKSKPSLLKHLSRPSRFAILQYPPHLDNKNPQR